MFTKYIELKKRISHLNKSKQLDFFLNLNAKDQATLLLMFSKKMQKFFLNALSEKVLLDIFDYFAPDDIVDFLQTMDKKKQERILKLLEKEIKEKVEFLLKFNPKTAAGIMSLDYIIVNLTDSLEIIAKKVKKHEKRTGRIPVVLIEDKGKIIGELPIHNLVLNEKIERKHVKKLPRLRYDAKKEELFSVFKSNPHSKVIVMDSNNAVLGIIYSDDLLDYINESINNTIYNFAGVDKEEDVLDNFLIKVKNRYKWLIINLATAFFAAFVVSLFEPTIAKFVVLAAYMPIVAGMGGNAATQAMAIMIRGLALKEVDFSNVKYVLFNEIFAGLINGVIVGLILAIIATILHEGFLLGIILFLSLVLNLIIAGFVGAFVPVIMKKLGKDPATVSSIIITTFTDVCGFFIFLGLATLLL